MSFVSGKPPTARPAATVPAALRRRPSRSRARYPRRQARTMALAAAAVTLVACASNNIKTVAPQPPSTSLTPLPPPPPPAGTTSPSTDTNQAVLSQYRHFWAALPAVSGAPPQDRRALLEPLAVNPELDSLLNGMAKQDSAAKGIYGQNVLSPRLQSSGQTSIAVVTDCQDSSGSGVADRKTGRHLTVGVKRNPAATTLHQGADGTWRVAFVAYGGPSC